MQLDGHALPAIGAGHTVEAISVSTISGLKKKTDKGIRQAAEGSLAVNSLFPQAIRTFCPYFNKELLEMIADQAQIVGWRVKLVHDLRYLSCVGREGYSCCQYGTACG